MDCFYTESYKLALNRDLQGSIPNVALTSRQGNNQLTFALQFYRGPHQQRLYDADEIDHPTLHIN